jgi:putative aldouronate transport system permease protein
MLNHARRRKRQSGGAGSLDRQLPYRGLPGQTGAPQLELQSMALPAMILLLIFSYGPMFGLVMAFQNYDVYRGFLHSEFVGFRHFIAFFHARNFWQIIRNTVGISLLKLAFGFTAPIALALAINEVHHRGTKRFFQTVSYLPHFISWVIFGGMVISMLSVENGSVNMLLQAIGVISQPINWLSQPNYFWGILVVSDVWKSAGFGSIIYLAAIAGINPELYESATIDGANRLQMMVRITLPSIKPQIIILFILALSRLLEAGFEDILMLTNFGQNAIVRPVSDVISTYVYRIGIENARYSYAAAAGLFRSVINVTMLMAANAMSRRFSETSLW